MDSSIPKRAVALLATTVLVVAACNAGASTAPSQGNQASTPPASAGSTASAGGPYTIGYSNGGGVGNGFREEQV